MLQVTFMAFMAYRLWGPMNSVHLNRQRLREWLRNESTVNPQF